MGSGAMRPKCKSQLFCLLAVRLWINYLTFPGLSFLFYEMRLIMPFSVDNPFNVLDIVMDSIKITFPSGPPVHTTPLGFR